AEYANDTGDFDLLIRHRHRIDAVAKLLLSLRAEALRRSPEDPAYGMISGWTEADACLDPDPARYMQPYFSNSTEASRGFEELGKVWEKAGAALHRPQLVDWGKQLRRESSSL